MKKKLFLILIVVMGFSLYCNAAKYYYQSVVATTTPNMGKVYEVGLLPDWDVEGFHADAIAATSTANYFTIMNDSVYAWTQSYGTAYILGYGRPVRGNKIKSWNKIKSQTELGDQICTTNFYLNTYSVSGSKTSPTTIPHGGVIFDSGASSIPVNMVPASGGSYSVRVNYLNSSLNEENVTQTLSVGGNSQSGSVMEGDSIILTANAPNDYSTLEGWYIGDTKFASDNPYRGCVTNEGLITVEYTNDMQGYPSSIIKGLKTSIPFSQLAGTPTMTAKFCDAVTFVTCSSSLGYITVKDVVNDHYVYLGEKQSVIDDNSFELLYTTNSNDYEFYGWYLENSSGTKTYLSYESDATVTITEAGKVYADIVKKTWDAKWMNGETVLKESGECESEDKLPGYTDALPTSTGKTFVGWAKSVDHHSITYSAVFVDNANATTPTVAYSAADGNVIITKPASLTNVTDYIVKLSDIASAITTSLGSGKKASSIDITGVASVYNADGSAPATASEIQTQMVTSTSNQNVLTYVPTSISGVSSASNVIQGGECSRLVLTDGGTDAVPNPFNVPSEFTANQVTYTRNSTATWGTIILPYAPVAKTGYTYYTLSNADLTNNKLTFTPVTGALKANTPYLYQNTTSENFNASTTSSVTIPVTGTTSTTPISNWTMNGVYKRTTVFSSTSHANYASCTNEKVVDANSYYIKADGSAFAKINGSFNINAFRAYLTTTDGVGAAKLLNFSIDDTPTGVQFIENEDKTVDVIFDMSGRKLDEPQKNAVNIINGKKVLVK